MVAILLLKGSWKTINLVVLLSLSFFILSCGDLSLRSVDREKVKEELANREIKRVTEAEIYESATKKGNEAVAKISKDFHHLSDSLILSTQLDSLQSFGLLNQLIDDANLASDNVIRFLEVKTSITGKENQDFQGNLLDAFIYSDSMGIIIEPNLHAYSEDTLVFTFPVYGTSDIGKKLHCQSNACGLWMIKIPKKALILSM